MSSTAMFKTRSETSRLHRSFPPSTLVQDGTTNSLLSFIEREEVISLPRRTLSLRRKPSTASLFSIKTKSNSNHSETSPKLSKSGWVRRVTDVFQMTRRDSAASTESWHEAEPVVDHSTPRSRPAFDEEERPSYESMFPVSPSQPTLRRQGSEESFHCRGLSSASSDDDNQSYDEVRHSHFFGFDIRAGCDQSSALHTRTSFSSFSASSEASGSSLTSASDYALPITPSSVERPLRPKTRPPSLSLNDNEMMAIKDMAKNDEFCALGIYDSSESSSQTFLMPPSMAVPFNLGIRRSASCDGGCEIAGASSARHTPRMETPPAHALPDVQLWIRFVGLPSDEALDCVSISGRSFRSRFGSGSMRTTSMTTYRTNNPPVSPFEMNPLCTVTELKERLADVILDRFGVGVSAEELTVSMHSLMGGPSPSFATNLALNDAGCLGAVDVSPTLRLGCSGASSDAGTATPNMAAAWSSTASLPSLLPVMGRLAAPPSTVVTELRNGDSTLWSEGVEDGFTLVARIRSLAFF
ncbi:unnamed protein product [Tilletia controversa]|uniref:Uncharacterized protein n=3 Tax=Tilletia TaxID=13289 RepID=A0A8X7T0W2_9BASI|nr:hypothetical protein CF336_g3386 [Tilletia laevis]KAE8205406.1 hypothetical protein CF328_g517 [Tilletia controversa]KAE8262026.1 hypothetical protein A4X03_0g2777 [Tilletia caries]KAE8204752.1 hypothetical protein CF335_g2541 [Tilletia laevis]KAE8255682.1 hypothetical protein A4X06_0g296 [Tilletia controversa]